MKEFSLTEQLAILREYRKDPENTAVRQTPLPEENPDVMLDVIVPASKNTINELKQE